MSSLVNLFDNDGFYYVGFFGSKLTTYNLRVICPSTTIPGGTIVSTNPNTFGSTFPTWNANTGSWINWSPSSAIIPTSSTVVYAALIWSTAYYPTSSKPPQEITADTHKITMIKPDGSSYAITPNPLYNLNFTAPSQWWQYTHAADITSIMQDNQYGHYFFKDIITGNYGAVAGCGGLGLYIVYSNPTFPYRNVNLNAAATGFNETVTIPNLILPATGPVKARVFALSVQGDRNYPDSLYLNGHILSGPYNPANDFMNDRYVDYTGVALQSIGSLMVETGSDFGYYSDQTVIDNSTALTNTDTNAVITQQNSGDWAGVSQIGLMVDLNSANLNPIVKAVDKSTAYAGNTLTYTIHYTNIGSTTAINIYFIDTLPLGTTFISNSLTVNSAPSTENVTTGVSLPNLAVGASTTLTFQVQTPSSATPGDIFTNFGNVSYDFIPGGTTIVSTSIPSNFVTTTIVATPITTSKSVDKKYATVGDTLTYTVVISTNSPSNIYLVDTIPTSTSFIPNSVTLNGIAKVGSPLPPSGVNLGTLPININNTITFKVTISTIPTNNPLLNTAFISSQGSNATTNITTTTVAYSFLTTSKLVTQTIADIGAILTYTITMTNLGNTTAYNIVFIDTIPNGTSFIATSLNQDNVNVLGSPNPPGISLPNSIKALGTSTVTFKVIVNSIPNPNPILNYSSENYSYLIDSSTNPNRVGTLTSSSNTVSTQINHADLNNMMKYVDKAYAICGEILTYTIIIPNSGNITANNVHFLDTIPTGTTFVSNSLKVNGVTITGANPENGITLPDIGPSSISTISFSVQSFCY